MKLTDQIVSSLHQQIFDGDIAPGQRLPTVREISRQFNTTIPTAQRALATLEGRGLATVAAGSGSHVINIQDHLQLHHAVDLLRAIAHDHERACNYLADLLAMRRDVVMWILRQLRAQPDTQWMTAMMPAIMDYRQALHDGDMHTIMEADLTMTHTALQVINQQAYLMLFNTLAAMIRAVPQVQTAMYAQPETIASKLADSSVELPSLEFSAELVNHIMRSYRELDTATLKRFRAILVQEAAQLGAEATQRSAG